MATVSGEHALRSVNEAERRAICSTCGPVKVFRSGGGWRCSIAHAEYKRLKRAEDKEKRLLTTELQLRLPCCKALLTLPPINTMPSMTDGVRVGEFYVKCDCGEIIVNRTHYARTGEDQIMWIAGHEMYVNGSAKFRHTPDDFEVLDEFDLTTSNTVGETAATTSTPTRTDRRPSTRPSDRRALVTA